MKYINLQTYNQNFLAKGVKPHIFFNPDNSVAIFEEADEEIRKYVWEKGEALKIAGFYMNPGTEQTIREYLTAEAEKNAVVKESQLETGVNVFDSAKKKPLLSKAEAIAMLEELEKPTVAKLSEIIKKIITVLQ
jgi:hypothetical protein